MKKVRRFKFLREGLKSEYNSFQWELGRWYETECTELCHGFNCSEKIFDALSYVKGEILAVSILVEKISPHGRKCG
jgi:hypothetical protein